MAALLISAKREGRRRSSLSPRSCISPVPDSHRSAFAPFLAGPPCPSWTRQGSAQLRPWSARRLAAAGGREGVHAELRSARGGVKETPECRARGCVAGAPPKAHGKHDLAPKEARRACDPGRPPDGPRGLLPRRLARRRAGDSRRPVAAATAVCIWDGGARKEPVRVRPHGCTDPSRQRARRQPSNQSQARQAGSNH